MVFDHSAIPPVCAAYTYGEAQAGGSSATMPITIVGRSTRPAQPSASPRNWGYQGNAQPRVLSVPKGDLSTLDAEGVQVVPVGPSSTASLLPARLLSFA